MHFSKGKQKCMESTNLKKPWKQIVIINRITKPKRALETQNACYSYYLKNLRVGYPLTA